MSTAAVVLAPQIDVLEKLKSCINKLQELPQQVQESFCEKSGTKLYGLFQNIDYFIAGFEVLTQKDKKLEISNSQNTLSSKATQSTKNSTQKDENSFKKETSTKKANIHTKENVLRPKENIDVSTHMDDYFLKVQNSDVDDSFLKMYRAYNSSENVSGLKDFILDGWGEFSVEDAPLPGWKIVSCSTRSRTKKVKQKALNFHNINIELKNRFRLLGDQLQEI